MQKALITFSNGETLELQEDQLIVPIVLFIEGEKKIPSKAKPLNLWDHIHDGLIPSIVELICSSEFFHLADYNDKVYKSSSVVSVENL